MTSGVYSASAAMMIVFVNMWKLCDRVQYIHDDVSVGARLAPELVSGGVSTTSQPSRTKFYLKAENGCLPPGIQPDGFR